MNRLATILTLLFLMIFSIASSNAQTTTRDRNEAFWNRFEKELDRFIGRITGDLPEDTLSTTVATAIPDSAVSEARTFVGSATIDKQDTIHGDVTVRDGDLTLLGTVYGDVKGERGTVFLKDGAVVTGNVRVTDGDIVRDEGATILGSMDWIRSGFRGPDGGTTRREKPFRLPWIEENTTLSHAIFRYNRVEGLFLGLGSEKKFYWDGRKDFSPYGSIGYGFILHRWRGNLGLARQFAFPSEGKDELLEIGLEGYSLTDTKDQWRIGAAENTAAAILIREDFRDYFDREGFTAHAAYYMQSKEFFAEAQLAYRADRYQSLDQNADWSLFGGHKVFRPNPPIDDGRMRSIVALVGASTTRDSHRAPDGWSVHANAEFASAGALGGDFTFQQYVADIRRYQPIGRFDNINVRMRIGSSHGTLPTQKAFDLGGLGSLPAFPFKAFSGGNRMILLNAEYSVYGDILGDLEFWPSWLMRHMNILFLGDAGLVRAASDESGWLDGFGGITWNEFKSDIGVGIGNRSGSLRLAVMWRTDRAQSPAFVFRVAAPF